jgi:RNA polymerase sigma factor (sigma-70 family)
MHLDDYDGNRKLWEPRTEAQRALAAGLDLVMEELGDAQREAVRLCDLERLTEDQAARLLGVSRNTVKSNKRDGRNKLRDELLRLYGPPKSAYSHRAVA